MPSPVAADTLSSAGEGITRASASSIALHAHCGRCGSRSILVSTTRSAVPEHDRVLERLVFALGDREHDDVRGLAEVVDRRAHEVADVLDEEELEADHGKRCSAGAPSARRGDRRCPVVIESAGIPAASSRDASRSVARSPASAPTAGAPPSTAAVASSSAVLPAPGDPMTFTAVTPCCTEVLAVVTGLRVVAGQDPIVHVDRDDRGVAAATGLAHHATSISIRSSMISSPCTEPRRHRRTPRR